MLGLWISYGSNNSQREAISNGTISTSKRETDNTIRQKQDIIKLKEKNYNELIEMVRVMISRVLCRASSNSDTY